MELSEELKKIKKVYGEKFMHLCRELFPTILETEGRLFEVLQLSFGNNSRTLYEDIVNNKVENVFKEYIYSKIESEIPEIKITQEKRNPYELLKKAGYDLTECTSEEEIQKFKKYYAPGEALCTFNGGRLSRCVVFFAVKKDVKNIKRKDFKRPKREDEYGTSVMGIQFSKEGKCTVSIKNRYNHRVDNPDATYGNDLDRIIPGLTESFKILLEQRGLELNSSNVENHEIPGYTMASDGKYYKYNIEVDGIYYCPGNIIIEQGRIQKLDASKQILIDYFVIDLGNKTISDVSGREDSFKDDLNDIEKIEITKDKEKGIRIIKISQKDRRAPIIIKIDKNNQIIEYENPNLTQIGNNFLYGNRCLTDISLPELTRVGDNFLYNNNGLTNISLPELTRVGDNFLYNNDGLTNLSLPELTRVGDNFLYNNRCLTDLSLPKLTQAGQSFMYENRDLKKMSLPRVTQIGSSFLGNNAHVTELLLPELTQIGDEFLYNNQELTSLSLPKLTQVGEEFLYNNQKLTNLSLPKLIQGGGNFLYSNRELTNLSLPELMQIGRLFLAENRCLTDLSLPKLTQAGDNFLYENLDLKKLSLPRLTQVRTGFLFKNQGLINLSLPEATQVEDIFLFSNQGLTKIDIPMTPQVEKALERIKIEAQWIINSKSIVIADRDNKLTTSEVSRAGSIIQRILNKMKEIMKGRDNE